MSSDNIATPPLSNPKQVNYILVFIFLPVLLCFIATRNVVHWLQKQQFLLV